MDCRLKKVIDHVSQGIRSCSVAAHAIVSQPDQSAKLAVLVNSKVLGAVRDSGDLQFGVPRGRAGNNNPESRRNKMVSALLGTQVAELIPAAAATDFASAELVHSGGFVNFLKSAFQRWETEMQRDASYVLPSAGDAEVALVPFHCTKSDKPLAPGLFAEFACYASDFETPIFESTASVLKDDLGVVHAAVDRICEGERAAYALTTHAGHHAGPSFFSGFCYINNASIACALLEKAGKRPALLDVDFHAGNGSFYIAQSSGRWFRSINCAKAYPWVDMETRGIELPAGTPWALGYELALEKVLSDMPNEIDSLVLSLGYDTLVTDPEAGKRAGVGLALETSDFYSMASMLAAKGLPMLVVQEGGYDLEGIPTAFYEFARGLAPA